ADSAAAPTPRPLPPTRHAASRWLPTTVRALDRSPHRSCLPSRDTIAGDLVRVGLDAEAGTGWGVDEAIRIYMHRLLEIPLEIVRGHGGRLVEQFEVGAVRDGAGKVEMGRDTDAATAVMRRDLLV